MIDKGTIISGCKITAELGQGGMGKVYKAFDQNLERDVAIKIILPEHANEANKKRFIREAASIAKCNHPGIIRIYNFGEFEKLPYFIMEYVDGKPLSSFLELSVFLKNAKNLSELKEYGYINEPSPEDEELPYFLKNHLKPPIFDEDYESHVSNLIADIADSLYEAHSMGILHRDIKPSNILLSKKGMPKIADFGLAKRKDAFELTGAQQIMGTLKYMTPEHFSKGEITHLSDIYSLGAVFYELLTLSFPFETENTALFIKSLTLDPCIEPIKANPKISRAINSVILKSLSKNPKERFQNAQEFADTIRMNAKHKGLKTHIFDGVKNLFGSDLKPAISTKISSETINIAPISKEDEIEANRLYEEGRKAYFNDWDLGKTISLMNEALELNPKLIDAHFVLMLTSNHITDISEIRKTLKKLKQLENTLNEQDKLKASIIVSIFEHQPSSKKLISKYSRQYPTDPYIHVFGLMGANICDNIQDYIKHMEKFKEIYPENNFSDWAIAGVYFDIGNNTKAISIMKKLIDKSPKTIIFRIILVQNLLEQGDLKETEKQINAALKLDPTNDLLAVFVAEMNLHKKNYTIACNYLRKFIGFTNLESLKHQMYYKLYLIYHHIENNEQAEKYLKIARNLAPEWNYLSAEEIKSKIDCCKISSSIFDDINRERFDFIVKKAKTLNLQFLLSMHNNQNYPNIKYYELGESGEIRNISVWPCSNVSIKENKKITLWLHSVPFSPFMDKDGNILKVNFKRIESVLGNYIAEITYQNPIPQYDFAFLTAELDASHQWKKNGSGEYKLLIDEHNVKIGHMSYIIAVPSDFEVLSVAPKPDEIIDLDNMKFYVYDKFLFTGEKSNLEISVKI